MASFLNQLQSNLGQAPIGKKVLALALIGGTIAGLAVLGLWAQRPELQVLYANLSQEDASTIVEKLKEIKVPYEVSYGGAILAPSDRIHELRLHLASQGLPQGGGVGFEIFDRTNLGMTDFIQKLNYRRALQGELARTINQLSEVEAARVHLVVPERSLFQEAQEKARGSVVLKLKPGRVLSSGQVQGIVHLVASSVEGLSPQNVTVVDTHGQILSKLAEDSVSTQLSSSQLDYQRTLEKDFENRIQSMLEKVVGTNKVAVRVASALDFKRIEMTEERFDPESAVVRSEQKTQEKSSGASQTAGGVPGVLSNLPGGQAAPSTGPTSSSELQRKNETINYEISKTTSRIIEPVGTLKKLSVAVLVDGTYEVVKDGEKETRKYLSRNEEEMKKYEGIVKTAMGFNPERGDQVEVVNVPFETGGVLEEQGFTSEVKTDRASFWVPLMRYGMVGVVFLVVFIFVLLPLVKVLVSPGGKQSEIVGGLPRTVAELEKGAPPEPREITISKEGAVQIARQHPEQTAQVLREWLKES